MLVGMASRRLALEVKAFDTAAVEEEEDEEWRGSDTVRAPPGAPAVRLGELRSFAYEAQSSLLLRSPGGLALGPI